MTAPHSASSETHFAFDDPSLTASGRQKIREFVARELKALRSPETLVTITGHASTKGPPRRNDPLSGLRAENAAQAIRDVGGPTVKAKIVHEGLGETKAREVDPDDTRNPQWRRVDIALNGIVVERLRIADE